MTPVTLAFAARANAGLGVPSTRRDDVALFVSTKSEADLLIVAEGTPTRDEIASWLAPVASIERWIECRPVGTLGSPTSTRATRGLLVGATDCGDDAALATFHDFYDRVHAREVVDSGLYWRARRFERVAPHVGEPRFFALYDTDGDEPETYRALRTRPRTTDWPPCFVVRSITTYRRA
jgi:hypothetical protein